MEENQIIDMLGGTNQVAKICDVTAQAVSQWRHKGIPPARRMYLKLLRPDAFEPAVKTADQDVMCALTKPKP